MESFFQILEVSPGASVTEVKHAFREKAKTLHPDISGSDGEKMKLLLNAYRKILEKISSEKSSFFDRQYFQKRKPSGDDIIRDYEEWLISRGDIESRAKLVFYRLIHGKETQACEEYLKLLSDSGNFSFEKYFDKEDFMDFGFILAEELYLRKKYYDSLNLLIRIFQLEKQKPYFKIFFPEVEKIMRDIYRNKLSGSIGDELALDLYEELLDLNLGIREDSVIFRRMADGFFRIGDYKTAEICAAEALKLDPQLTGFKNFKKEFS